MKIVALNMYAKNELNILAGLSHENIVKYFTSFEVNLRSNNGEVTPNLCIVTEFCEVWSFVFSTFNLNP